MTLEWIYKTVVLLVVSALLFTVLYKQPTCDVSKPIAEIAASLLAVNNTCGDSGPCTVETHY